MERRTLLLSGLFLVGCGAADGPDVLTPPPAPTPTPPPVPPPPPAAWNLNIVPLLVGVEYNLTVRLPAGVPLGGRFSVSPTGAPLPASVTLSSTGVLLAKATHADITGVIFQYDY